MNLIVKAMKKIMMKNSNIKLTYKSYINLN